MNVSQYIQQYREALESGKGLRAGIAPVDAVAEMTGGGVTTQGVKLIGEYLSGCLNLEKKRNYPVWKGPWQEGIVDWIGAHPYSSIQAGRRLGKTYAVGVWGAAYIAAGLRVIMALPTVGQSKRLIFRQIVNNVERLLPAFPAIGRRLVDQPSMGEILWENAGQITCLSSHADAEVEGYGCEFLIIDEGHKTQLDRVAVFQPFVDDAILDGIGRVVMVGIGGPLTSALEGVKFLLNDTERLERDGIDMSKIQRYQSLHYDADEIVKDWPELKPRFDQAKATMTQADYDKNYRCLPEPEGTEKIFQSGIAKEARTVTDNYRLFAGIDPGKRQDDSVMTVFEVKPSAIAGHNGNPQLACNLIERVKLPRGLNYPAQARAYIQHWQDNYPNMPAKHLSVEYNGVGDGLADMINEVAPGINYYWSSPEYNGWLIGRQQIKARERTMGIHDDATRREIESLYMTREAKPDTGVKIEYQHNDTHASMRAAFFGMAM